MLFDIRRLAWDPELCDLLGVDPARLPEPLPSAHVYGTTGEFGGEVPVAGIAGDQQAALFGQACHRPGMAKNTYGTGSFVLLNTGSEAPRPPEGLLATVAWGPGAKRPPTRWRPRSSSPAPPCSGCATGSGSSSEAGETEALAASLDSNDGVYFVPALTGLGSPHWDPYARGTIVGLTRGSGRAHLARAALEAIAYQTVDAVRAQEAAAGERLEMLKADGGAVANRWLMQFQADVLGAPVVVPEIAETTALGAAYLAGIATGRLERASRWGRCGARRPATSRGWAPTSARRCWPSGGGRWSARAAGPSQGELTSRTPIEGSTRQDVNVTTTRGEGRQGRRPRLPPSRHGGDEATGLQGPAPGGVLRAVPRGRAQGRRLDLHARPRRPHPADAADLPGAGDRRRERAARGRAGPRPQPLQPDGPLLRRRLPAAEDPLHGQIAALRPAGPDLHLQARRRLPGPPRPPRRGGVQDRARDPAPGRDAAGLRRGRPLALGASWASRNRGSAGSRWNRARRSCRSRSTARPRCAAGSGCASPRSRSSSASRSSFPVEAAPSRERQLEAATEVFDRVREMYEGLATRSERRAGSRSPDRAPA